MGHKSATRLYGGYQTLTIVPFWFLAFPNWNNGSESSGPMSSRAPDISLGKLSAFIRFFKD